LWENTHRRVPSPVAPRRRFTKWWPKPPPDRLVSFSTRLSFGKIRRSDNSAQRNTCPPATGRLAVARTGRRTRQIGAAQINLAPPRHYTAPPPTSLATLARHSNRVLVLGNFRSRVAIPLAVTGVAYSSREVFRFNYLPRLSYNAKSPHYDHFATEIASPDYGSEPTAALKRDYPSRAISVSLLPIDRAQKNQ